MRRLQVVEFNPIVISGFRRSVGVFSITGLRSVCLGSTGKPIRYLCNSTKAVYSDKLCTYKDIHAYLRIRLIGENYMDNEIKSLVSFSLLSDGRTNEITLNPS